jgi:hypothetical protein
LIDGVFEVEFGVLTDCGSSVDGLVLPQMAGLLVYPNPAEAMASVVMNAASFDGRAQWVLADGLGRVVREGTSAMPLWALPLQGLEPGGYLLHVQSGIYTAHRRVVVAR